MSIHFSKFSLNTYYGSPYFIAHVPEDYPVGLVLIKGRAFRRLPPRLRKLSALAKKYECRRSPFPFAIRDMENWYDDEGYELNPETKERLTDEELDAQWGEPGADLAALLVKDIPEPEGGFADPDTWEEPPEPEEPSPYEGPDLGQLLRDIESHGLRYVARYYGVPTDQLPKERTPEALAHAILRLRKGA